MKDRPLKCGIEDGEVVIRVGVNTLKIAAESCNEFYDDAKHSKGPPYVKIVNDDEFAADIVRMLNSEDEDGSGPLSNLFDTAIVAAYEDGSLGFEHEKI